jgi:raffinose/stachyose/melibiose transport system permease protein
MKTEKKGSWAMLSSTAILSILYISPLYFCLISAFKTNGEIMRDPIAFPSVLRFDNFLTLWKETDFAQGFLNSLFLTIVSEILIILVIPIAAYAIERSSLKIAKHIYIYFIAGMMIPFYAYMIPLFKELKLLHLFGNYAGPVIVYVSGATAFGTLLFTSFIKGIPKEIEESAQIDGCSNFRIFWSIVFPLLTPCTSSLIILNGLGIWNDYLMPSYVLPSGRPKTVNVEIYKFIGELASRWDIVFAGAVCGIIPILIVFVALQKYFIKGITTGAAKG